MRKLQNLCWPACKSIGIVVLLIAVGCLMLLFYVGAPLAVVAETYDLLVMDARADGLVTEVQVQHGRKGTSAVRVTYEFAADGLPMESQNLYPGFLGNRGSFSGGRRLAEDFRAGQRCTVLYDSSSPTRCSIQHGWFQWSVGFTAGVWGMTFAAYFASKNKMIFGNVAKAIAYYGAGLIFVGPFTVRVSALHWHVVTIVGLVAVLCSKNLFRRNGDEHTSTPNVDPARHD